MSEKRENYRETPVAGTDIVVYSWTEGAGIRTRVSWPPHGIERPLGIVLTLSADEVATIGDAYDKGMNPEAEALLVNIGNAMLVQCGILRNMQKTDPAITLRPLPSDDRTWVEPVIHSHITDTLPAEHPLARVTVHCDGCREMLHCENNECMQTWVELSDRNLCAPCFGKTCEVLPLRDPAVFADDDDDLSDET